MSKSILYWLLLSKVWVIIYIWNGCQVLFSLCVHLRCTSPWTEVFRFLLDSYRFAYFTIKLICIFLLKVVIAGVNLNRNKCGRLNILLLWIGFSRFLCFVKTRDLSIFWPVRLQFNCLCNLRVYCLLIIVAFVLLPLVRIIDLPLLIKMGHSSIERLITTWIWRLICINPG